MFLLLGFGLLAGLIVGLVLVFHLFWWNSVYCVGYRSWVSSFECGFLSVGLAENYFSYTYFILLVFFVLFDLEVSLLLNIPFQGVLYKNFGCYSMFLMLLAAGFSAEVYKGFVQWFY